MSIERRFAELRADGERVLAGTLLRYDDVADIGGLFKERIVPGAFGQSIAGDIVLTAHHRRDQPLARTGHGLTLTDSPQALMLRADLPETTLANDVLVQVRHGLLAGLSLEFRVHGETQEGDLRVVRHATLTGASVVDRPAYGASTLEARRKALVGETYAKLADCLPDYWG